MLRLHGVHCRIAGQSISGAKIVLALAGRSHGKEYLPKAGQRAKWPPPRNREEGYLLDVGRREAVVIAQSPRGLLYGSQTLLQLVRPAESPGGKQLLGVTILDYPQLPFRGVHLCIFPNTELAAIRQAILLAARFKYNAVVIEPWASLKSKSHPETAYEDAYRPDEIRPVVELGRALCMDMIPMLNSWGHASGMRRTSAEHVVLDRFPEFKGLYEPDGWSFCLTNPAIYGQLFDRYGELLELFGPTPYFHAGMDEAWGHMGLMENCACRSDNPRKVLVEHLGKIHGYFAQREMQVIMWHDMFLQPNHPQLGRVSPAGSVPPINSHLALETLPKDVIIAAWNYAETRRWPVPRYFHEKGFRVLVCPWKTRPNTVALVNAAKQDDLFGLLATTWDSLDVSLPSVAQAGVLAWTAPSFDLNAVPFDHWLAALRKLPITALPKYEPLGKEQE
jgi:hypothetical protein